MLITLIVLGGIAWGVKALFFDEPDTYQPAYQAARTFVSVTLQAIRTWLGYYDNAVYADVIRQHLANGQFNVVSIGLNTQGAQVARKVWSGPVANDLSSAFGTAHQFRIHT